MIAISGKVGSGKTTLAKILVDRLGFPWLRASFADPLKREVMDLFGLHPDLLWSEEGKKREFEIRPDKLQHLGIHTIYPELLSVRRILQLRGQYCRSLDPNYWVDAFQKEHQHDDHIVVDDVRYENELALAHSRKAYCVRLLPYPGWVPGQYATHESETSLDADASFQITFRPQYGGLDAVADYILSEYNRRYGR